MPGKDGLLHISEIDWKRLETGKSTEQRRVQKSREQYSTVEQTRAEKKRVDITAEQNKIEN